MSTRSLLEFNHDYIPSGDGDTLALGVQLHNYMRASNPAELPKGVRLLARRHHSEPAFVAGWQPIKTAPIDGTEVDLWVRRSNPSRGFRVAECHYHCGEWLTQQIVLADSTDSVWESVTGATHWMPLPEPPHDP